MGDTEQPDIAAVQVIDLELIRRFIVVAEELHFTRAAERLFVSQPALSKQVRMLERQLGAPLFERDSQGVRLTHVGSGAASARPPGAGHMGRRLGGG
jgi:Bacterial regulatory helix-turn-helix protein, lysR family